MDKPRFRVRKPKFNTKRKKSKEASSDTTDSVKSTKHHANENSENANGDKNTPVSRDAIPHYVDASDNLTPEQSDLPFDNVNVRSTVSLSHLGAGDGYINHDNKQMRKQIRKLPRPSSTIINHMAAHTNKESMSENSVDNASKSVHDTPTQVKNKQKRHRDRNLHRIPVLVKTEKQNKLLDKSISQSNTVNSDIATAEKSIDTTLRGSKLPTSKHKSNTFPRKKSKTSSSRNSTGGDSVISSLSEASKEVSAISQHVQEKTRAKSSSPVVVNIKANNGRKSDPGVIGWRSLASDRLRAKISRPLSPLATVIGRESYDVTDALSLEPLSIVKDSTEVDKSKEKVVSLLNKNTLRKGIVTNTLNSKNVTGHKAPIHRLNATVDGLNSILDKLTSNYMRGDNSLNSSTCSLYSENFSGKSNSLPDVFASAKQNVLTSSSGTPRGRNQSLEQSWIRNRSFFLRCTEVRRKQHRREWESNKISGNTDRHSIFGQRNVEIRKLTRDLESAQRLIKMQEEEICRLHANIVAMRESAIEEECYRVEAQVDKIRAENDVRLLEATINNLRSNMEELKQSRKDYISKQEATQQPQLVNENIRSTKELDLPFESRYHNTWSTSQPLHGSLPSITPTIDQCKATVVNSKQKKDIIFNIFHVLFLGESFMEISYISRYQVFAISRVLKFFMKQ